MKMLFLLLLALPFAQLEQRAHGRLGVYAIDRATGAETVYRADERFPMLSTFKLPLVVAIFTRVDAGQERMDRRIPVSAADVLFNSPVVEQHLKAGDHDIPIRELCMGAIRYSDNAAANLLLKQVGGPAGLTAWMRSIGDTVFRLDRMEPMLGESKPGDDQDTSTPRAMAAFVRRLTDRTILTDSTRAIVLDWLRTGTTGDAKFRAGVPAGWTVNEKTGGASKGSNDLGFFTAPDGHIMIAAAYLTGTDVDTPVQNAVIADVARALTGGLR